MSGPGPAATSLLATSVRGVFWSVGAQGTAQFVHLGVRLLLARLLAPDDFGVFAISMVVISCSWWLLDLSFGQALVQRREVTEAHRATAFWSNVAAGATLAAALALASPLVARFFKTPDAGLVFAAMSMSLLWQSPEATLTALLQRELRFKALAVRQVAGALAGGAAAVALALSGFGVWAFVGECWARSACASALLFLQAGWRPSLAFSREAFLDLWAFSGRMVSARLLNNVNRNIDTVLVGRMLGPATLGVYNVGYQFVLLPQVYFSRAVNNVLFPVLSRIQEDAARLLGAYRSALLLVASVVFPVMTLVALLAPVLVPLVLGPRWEAVVPLVPWMCLAGAMQSVQGIAMTGFFATGRPDRALRWVAVTTAVNSVAIACGVLHGVQAVVMYYGVVNVGLAAGTHFAFCLALKARVSTPLRALAPALMTNAFVFLPWLLYARSGGGAAFAPPLATTIGLCLLSLAAYGVISWKCNPEAWRFLRRLRELRREQGHPG